VDLGAVKAAPAPRLAACAVGAAANAQGLLDDAELLSSAARHARAYSLAALAVEEAGKAAALFVLALMPRQLRARAPLGRMLQWHQLKLVGGMLIAAVPFGPRTIAAQLLAMPQARVVEILDGAQALAQDLDCFKQRGLYADIDSGGRVRLPSEVADTDVPVQLCRARRAVSSASVLLDPDVQARLAHPPAEVVELCRALVSAFAEAGYSRTPEAAANVMLDAVSRLQEQTASLRRRRDRPAPAVPVLGERDVRNDALLLGAGADRPARPRGQAEHPAQPRGRRSGAVRALDLHPLRTPPVLDQRLVVCEPHGEAVDRRGARHVRQARGHSRRKWR